MIKFVLLDLDDTIFDFGYAEKKALESVLSEIGVSVNDRIKQRYSEINSEYWKRLEVGELTRKEVQVGRFTSLFEELEINADPVLTNAEYMSRIANIVHYVDGAEQLLVDLRNAGYLIYIVSNGSVSVQNGRMKQAGLEHFFDGVFLSEHLGVEKPNKAFFDACAASIADFDAAHAIVVGDSLTSDILGGINAGIMTCWFNPKKKAPAPHVQPDYEIDHLSKLLPLLQSL